jgi:hypothetical protein
MDVLLLAGLYIELVRPFDGENILPTDVIADSAQTWHDLVCKAAVPLDETSILHLLYVSMLLHELQVSFQEDRCVPTGISQSIDDVSVALATDWSDGVLMDDLVVLFHDLAETDRTVSNELMGVHIDIMDRQRARNWRPQQPEHLEVRPVQCLEAVELAMHVQIG